MARIRTIKPEFFRSRSLAKCDRDARLTFAGLWTEADDHGHGVADPRILKGAIWPLDDDVTHQHVSAHLRVLVETGHIRLYEVDGETYYEVVNWSDHQAAAYRRGEPKHPAPEAYLDDVSHDDVQESAGRTDSRAGREGKGTGKGKTLAPDKPTPKKPRPPDPVFEAVVEACGLDLAEVTDTARGAINRAAKELRQVGATPEGIKARAQIHRKKWPDATCSPSSLAKNYAQLNAKTSAADPGRREPEFGTSEWDARARERQKRAEALTGGGT